jgi:hypothetical protein
VCFIKNEYIKIQYSEKRVTGILTVFNATNPAVSNYGKQEPGEDLGVDTFEFWCPQRRPEGRNLAFTLAEPIRLFESENIRNGFHRPVSSPNAWVVAYGDQNPEIALEWDNPTTISSIELVFDTDFDHPMENVIYVHPETVMPFCASEIEIFNDQNELIGSIKENHQTKRTINVAQSAPTRYLKIKVTNSNPNVPASLFEIRAYA